MWFCHPIALRDSPFHLTQALQEGNSREHSSVTGWAVRTPQPSVMANLAQAWSGWGSVGMLEGPTWANPGRCINSSSAGNSCGSSSPRGLVPRAVLLGVRHLRWWSLYLTTSWPSWAQRPASILGERWVYTHGYPQGSLRPGSLSSLSSLHPQSKRAPNGQIWDNWSNKMNYDRNGL